MFFSCISCIYIVNRRSRVFFFLYKTGWRFNCRLYSHHPRLCAAARSSSDFGVRTRGFFFLLFLQAPGRDCTLYSIYPRARRKPPLSRAFKVYGRVAFYRLFDYAILSVGFSRAFFFFLPLFFCIPFSSTVALGTRKNSSFFFSLLSRAFFSRICFSNRAFAIESNASFFFFNLKL